MINKNEESLLDTIARKCDCFISDLNTKIVYDKRGVYLAINDISITQFTFDEWNIAADYLFHQNNKFKSTEEAKKYCLKQLT